MKNYNNMTIGEDIIIYTDEKLSIKCTKENIIIIDDGNESVGIIVDGENVNFFGRIVDINMPIEAFIKLSNFIQLISL